MKDLISRLILGVIITMWLALIVYGFRMSWNNIPLRKYKGRLQGQICLVITHTILICLMYAQILTTVSNTMFWIAEGFALAFFLLWLLGFRIIERRDLELKWLINKHKHKHSN